MEALAINLKVRFRLSCDKTATLKGAFKLISEQNLKDNAYKLIIVQITEEEENSKVEQTLKKQLLNVIKKSDKKTLIMMTNQNEQKQGNQIVENPLFEEKLTQYLR